MYQHNQMQHYDHLVSATWGMIRKHPRVDSVRADQRSGLNNRVCVFFFSISLKQNPHGRQAFSGEPGRLRLNSSAHSYAVGHHQTYGRSVGAADLLARELDLYLFCVRFTHANPHRYVNDSFEMRDEMLRHTPPLMIPINGVEEYMPPTRTRKGCIALSLSPHL